MRRHLIILVFINSCFGLFAQKTAVLISSFASQEQLNELQIELIKIGVQFEVLKTEWTEDASTLKSLSFRLRKNGKWAQHDFNYHLLNQSVICLMMVDENLGGAIYIDTKQLQEKLWDSYVIQDKSVEKIISNFHQAIDIDDNKEITQMFGLLRDHFAQSLSVLDEVLADRNIISSDSKSSHYQYFYNGEKLINSRPINESDMNSQLEIIKRPGEKPLFYFKSTKEMSVFDKHENNIKM